MRLRSLLLIIMLVTFAFIGVAVTLPAGQASPSYTLNPDGTKHYTVDIQDSMKIHDSVGG